MERRRFLMIALVLVATIVLAAPAIAGDINVRHTVTPQMSQGAMDNLPDPEETGNMLSTRYAVEDAWDRAGKDTSQLSYIVVEIGGEDWLIVDPPRLYFDSK